MIFKNKKAEAEYAKIKALNEDGEYSGAVIRFMDKWTELLEDKITNRKFPRYIIRKNAEQTAKLADTENITGRQCDYAVDVLSQTWKYGKTLRRWYLSQM